MNKNYYNVDINMQECVRTYKYKNIEILKLTIKYPIISIKSNPYAERSINQQISLNVSEYIRYVDDYLYYQGVKTYLDSQPEDFPFHPYEAYMEYKVTYNENCFLSTYVDKYEFTGGAHGNTIRSSNTWELVNGTKLPLYSFFTPGTCYLRLLTEEIIKQAENNMNKNQYIYFDDYKKLIIKNFNKNNFYLTPKGLTIFYQQYDIAPYSTGIVEFTVPYSTIGWHPNC